MNPRHLKLRNLRTFVELDLALPEGRIAIVGQNGSGKSTLATAIDWALFGAGGRSFAPYLTQGAAGMEMLLELAFEHAGREYVVRRSYSSRGNGKTTLDLLVLDETVLEMHPLTRETVKETQAFLETLLGLSRETFRASSMLVQGDGAAFTEALPRDRKQILARILGLERWDVYRDTARTQIRQIENALDRIIALVGRAEEELVEREDVEAQLKLAGETLADAEAEGKRFADLHKRLEQEIREASQNAAVRSAAVARLAQAEQRLEPLRGRTTAAAEATLAQTVVAEELDQTMTPSQIDGAQATLELMVASQATFAQRTLEARVANEERARILDNIAGLAGEIGRAEAKIDDLLTNAAQLRDPEFELGEACPHCGQPLTSPASREHAAETHEAEAAALQAATRDLRDRKEALQPAELVPLPEMHPDFAKHLQAAQANAERAIAAITQRARLEERLTGLRQKIDAAPSEEELTEAAVAHRAAQDALAALPAAADPADLAAATRAATDAEQGRDRERVRWQAAGQTQARLRERLDRIEKTAAELADALAKRAQMQADLDELKVLERAYGRDGIPAWIVAHAALPSIQAEATRILAELGTSYRVELRTERATGAGDIVDALDVIVTTHDGERPYETFSGGERTRINLALRIALARLLANRRRGESRLLVIDEPEFLDEPGTAALIQVLAGLTDFTRIYLISHVPALRDAALDGTLEVTRGPDGWSQVIPS